jgi:hypothetical protein
VEVANLIIAIVALVIAVASAVWTAATWILEGGRGKATLLVGEATQDKKLMVITPDKFGKGTAISIRDEYEVSVIAVKVHSAGRSPVVVQDISFKHISSGMELTPDPLDIGPDLPHTLEPGANATWAVAMGYMDALIHSAAVVDSSGRREIAVVVELGNGRTLTTATYVVPPPGRRPRHVS